MASPINGATVYTDSISVGGLVNDIVRGTISESEALVIVNGQQAAVANRSYLAENIPMLAGSNPITIHATDAAGNSAQEQITVTYQPQVGKVIELVSGQSQSAVINESIAQPFIVKLTEKGQPVVDKVVVFRVIKGDGLLQAGTSDEGNGAVVQTDAQGQARVTFKLGSRAGNGNHRVRAKAVGFAGEVEFYASAGYGAGIQMGIIAGNNQRGSIKQPLPQPFTLAVTDAGANLIPNADIQWQVTRGGGRFANGETSIINQTDMDGRASASFILGSEEGLDVQRVTAKLVGTDASSGFTASGFIPGDPGETAISGVVLDNQDRPMPAVTIRVEGSTRQAITDDQGQFTLTEAPVGPVQLIVEGSTTSRTGEWPGLSYNIVTVPGVDNPMAGPIYLVEIDTQNAVYVGAEDKIVTHPDIPGFKLEVKAGSVTFPDGSKQGSLSITRVNANKIPMPPPNGMQPQLIVTIQPHGAKFDPPARLTLPNTDAHPPLAEIEMYSYDHDLEEFVTIGLGTVSRDGATLTSNRGSGVIKAGWHCGSQPGGNGCCTQPGDECDDYCKKRVDDENCSLGRCELVPDRQAEEQTEGDCQTALCEGSENDDSDFDASTDVQYDCKKPGCLDGSITTKYDDGDAPEEECKICSRESEGVANADDETSCSSAEDQAGDCRAPGCLGGSCNVSGKVDDSDKPSSSDSINNECKTCSEGNVISDTTKESQSCGEDGNLDQLCFECRGGNCREPDSDDCCAKYGNEDPGLLGTVVCCNGKKLSCNYPYNIHNWPSEYQGGLGEVIGLECVAVHENAHNVNNHISCDTHNCNDRPFFDIDPGFGECDASRAELSCLDANISRCGDDVSCTTVVDSWRKEAIKYGNKNYACF